MLESRAANPGYARMVDTLFEQLDIEPGETVVEVGCGSGALCRQLASRQGDQNPIIATDLSPFQVEEAEAISHADGIEAPIEFRIANAEALPFDDASIDVIFSVTVLEECDADRAIAEMHRVLRPGGRAGIVVRATDVPGNWNLDVPPALQRTLNDQTGLVGSQGCADRSLYSRFASHFSQTRPYSYWWTSAPPISFLVEIKTASLEPADRATFLDALQRGTESGTAFAASPVHCVVGTKA